MHALYVLRAGAGGKALARCPARRRWPHATGCIAWPPTMSSCLPAPCMGAAMAPCVHAHDPLLASCHALHAGSKPHGCIAPPQCAGKWCWRPATGMQLIHHLCCQFYGTRGARVACSASAGGEGGKWLSLAFAWRGVRPEQKRSRSLPLPRPRHLHAELPGPVHCAALPRERVLPQRVL